MGVISARAKPGRKPRDVPRITLNLRIDPEIHRQLRVHALISNSTASDIVSGLIRKHVPIYDITTPNVGG